MSDNAKKLLTIPMSKFGDERCDLEVEQGATYKDLYAEIPDASKYEVLVGDTPIEDVFDTEVDEESIIFVAPKKISQG